VALGSALVDRARPLREQPTADKVEGTTQFATVPGEWFRCRLDVTTQPESPDPSGGRRRVEARPSLLYEWHDAAGLPVALTTEDRVEVASPELGTAVWLLEGDPRPLRKKRRVIGFEATLRRVIDHEFVPVVVP
jgi:hypothetical protein